MEVHEFVFMPNHVHLLLTPAPAVSLEKSIQFIKGGFSFRVGKELGFKGDVWQKGFNEHRMRDVSDYEKQVDYTHMNPVKAGLVTEANEWRYSSAHLTREVDPPHAHLFNARQ